MADGSAIEWSDELRARFWANVDKDGPTMSHMDSPCWLWTAGCFTSGYGQFRAGARKVRAHRAAYELGGGVVPEGLILRHRCDVRRCCRPGHLLTGTHQDNADDREERGRGAHVGTSLPGEENPAAKLTKDKAIEIRLLRSEGCSREELAADYGISTSTVRAIEENRIWRGYGPEDLD